MFALCIQLDAEGFLFHRKPYSLWDKDTSYIVNVILFVKTACQSTIKETTMKELEKTYNPSEIEGKLYQKWLDKKYFHAKPNPDKKPFTIVMPPPNITGQLHMGHALDNTMQAILIPYKNSKKKRT